MRENMAPSIHWLRRLSLNQMAEIDRQTIANKAPNSQNIASSNAIIDVLPDLIVR